MSPLPPELVIKIGRILPPISAKVFSRVFGSKSTDKDRKIWDKIFKSEEYASQITTLGLELILLGADLQQPQGSYTYILLTYVGIATDKLWKHKDLFLKSLKRYTLHEDGRIQLLDSNIILFTAGDILSDKMRGDVLELRRLFSTENGDIKSVYLNWNGYKCTRVGRSQIAGALGKNATLEDVSNVCMVQLPKHPKKEGHLLLLRSGFPVGEKLSVLTQSLHIYAAAGWPWDK